MQNISNINFNFSFTTASNYIWNNCNSIDKRLEYMHRTSLHNRIAVPDDGRVLTTTHAQNITMSVA
jgi:hypothetical protein